MGINFYVDNRVLIPQPDTEILVQNVIKIVKSMQNNCQKEIKVLDLCTGSGIIGICLYKNLQNVKIVASDVSREALEVAEKNAKVNDAKIDFIESNLFEKINNCKFDVIVSNPPYIETSVINELSLEVKHEPNLALDGGEDGLDFYKKIIKEARNFLNKDGVLAFEIGYNQREAVENLFKINGYKNIISKKDLANLDRVVIGQML